MDNVDLFGEIPSPMMSIEDAAKSINVSNATIRNWLKLGYLKSAGNRFVCKSSLDYCVKEIVGKHKLNTRANKQHKQAASDNVCYSVDNWQNYESSLTESHRNREGVYYTPTEIVNDMFSKIQDGDFSQKRFLDPCCGSGNFIIRAIELGFAPHNVYGYDIDPNAVAITKKRIKDLTGYDSENIKRADFLVIADSLDLKVDFIYTNPPWGKKIDKQDRDKLVAKYRAGRSYDSSSLFLYASLPLLADGGKIGFLLQEAFFNIGTYVDIRRRLFDLRVDCFVDYGRAFKGLLTKACALIATNSAHREEPILCQGTECTYHRSRASFECNPQLIFNFNTSAAESDVIKMLFNRHYITLKDRAKWGLGVVTGDNKRFCSSEQKAGYKPIYRGSDITADGFKEPSLYIDPDLSKYQQVAPIDMYNSRCKIVYKFISNKLCFLCDTDQSLILNSANFLILNDDFPISAMELTKFLNSKFVNWLFGKIFYTHKILRGNLEMLPIFLEGFEGGIFCEDRYLECLNIIKIQDGTFKIKK
ncbi:MAG: TaqI-like C-terminal specificity domain-containing protein [Rikenellaceae bacterium]